MDPRTRDELVCHVSPRRAQRRNEWVRFDWWISPRRRGDATNGRVRSADPRVVLTFRSAASVTKNGQRKTNSYESAISPQRRGGARLAMLLSAAAWTYSQDQLNRHKRRHLWQAWRVREKLLSNGIAARHAWKTMQSIDLIRDNLTKSKDRVLARVEEMREHCTVFPTPRGGGHTLWYPGIWRTSKLWLSADSCLGKRIRWLSGRRSSTERTLVATSGATLHSTKCSPSAVKYGTDGGAHRLTVRGRSRPIERERASRLSIQICNDCCACRTWPTTGTMASRGHLADARRAAGVERMWL